MDQGTNKIMFSLLRSAICGEMLSGEDKALICGEQLQKVLSLSKKHDLIHLVAFALKKNELAKEYQNNIDNEIIKACYRYEQLNYEFERACVALEEAEIPFIPLKGSVIRKYYPEAWMRTSCDVDILIKRDDIEKGIEKLTSELGYKENERATHDVSLFTPGGMNIELHFDLVEEGRANFANDVLSNVWENVSLRADYKYWYEMSDEFFYFYHIAHMAKHFEVGGCGVRPFIDLMILECMEISNEEKRNALLEAGGLLKFALSAKKLANTWFGDGENDSTCSKMESYILQGGVYGSSQNRVELQQSKKGGRLGYIFSRIFIPYDKLKRYYPILEKHRWLTPIMQVRRWFMLLNPKVAKMAKSELAANKSLDKNKADEMHDFLNEIGL